METAKILLLIAAFIGCTQAYSYLIPANSNNQGICYYNGLYLQRGENYLTGKCQRMNCYEDGSILVEGCGHYDTNDCRIIDPLNLQRPYPECCKLNFRCGQQDIERNYNYQNQGQRVVRSSKLEKVDRCSNTPKVERYDNLRDADYYRNLGIVQRNGNLRTTERDTYLGNQNIDRNLPNLDRDINLQNEAERGLNIENERERSLNDRNLEGRYPYGYLPMYQIYNRRPYGIYRREGINA